MAGSQLASRVTVATGGLGLPLPAPSPRLRRGRRGLVPLCRGPAAHRPRGRRAGALLAEEQAASRGGRCLGGLEAALEGARRLGRGEVVAGEDQVRGRGGHQAAPGADALRVRPSDLALAPVHRLAIHHGRLELPDRQVEHAREVLDESLPAQLAGAPVRLLGRLEVPGGELRRAVKDDDAGLLPEGAALRLLSRQETQAASRLVVRCQLGPALAQRLQPGAELRSQDEAHAEAVVVADAGQRALLRRRERAAEAVQALGIAGGAGKDHEIELLPADRPPALRRVADPPARPPVRRDGRQLDHAALEAPLLGPSLRQGGVLQGRKPVRRVEVAPAPLPAAALGRPPQASRLRRREQRREPRRQPLRAAQRDALRAHVRQGPLPAPDLMPEGRHCMITVLIQPSPLRQEKPP